MTFKQYTAGDILTVADANLLMRQGLIVVANDVARDQISVPTEGMRIYRLDTHGIETYTGTAWDAHDTGWLSIAVAAGYSRQGSNDPEVRRIGDLIIARWGWSNTGLATNSDHVVGTVPPGLRPQREHHTVPATNSAAAQAAGARMVFLTNGQVQIRTGATVGGYYLISGMPWTRN